MIGIFLVRMARLGGMWPTVSAHGIARQSKIVPMIVPQQTSPAGLSSRQAGPAAGCGAGFRAGFRAGFGPAALRVGWRCETS